VSGGVVTLVGLEKKFGSFTAVDGIDLEIPAGEFFSMLGPSGCGKTTTLRMIAGFERPTAGEVLLDGEDMSNTSPSKRPVHTVFQSYALFPHLKVFDNVAFGLRRQGVPRAEVRTRVDEALELVRLVGYGKRKPAQLSGGQQQRVALARALVMKPSVLLLDEPLGALDAKLRRQLQVELKLLQEQVGITFVYVTHDQEEALTMSDRIAVMNGGRVEQCGQPREVYEEPATAFVADFLGVSNLMTATATGPSGSGAAVQLDTGIALEAQAGDIEARGPVRLVIRPERVRIEPAGVDSPNHVPGIIQRSVYLGNSEQVSIVLASGQTINALVQNSADESAEPMRMGTAVSAYLPAWALRVLPEAQQDSQPIDASAPA
jgi:spermidine/putrescine transport system ATP-binding protein